MNIIRDYPPNYAKIIAAIPEVKKYTGAVFTYGDTLYVPDKKNSVPDHLIAHEAVHAWWQTAMGIDTWWNKYLTDKQFRLDQEVDAYQAQYKCLCDNHNRHYRRQVTAQIVIDLSSDLYGGVINSTDAKALITEPIKLPSR